MVNKRTIARLEARIHERAAHCLEFEVSDPRASFITITNVELSSDLSSGKIHYSVLGNDADKANAKRMLDSAAGYIQRRVARVLELRRMPHLKWYYDASIEEAAKLEERIQRALERDQQIHTSGKAEVDDQAAWEAEYGEVADDEDLGPTEFHPKPRN